MKRLLFLIFVGIVLPHNVHAQEAAAPAAPNQKCTLSWIECQSLENSARHTAEVLAPGTPASGPSIVQSTCGPGISWIECQSRLVPRSGSYYGYGYQSYGAYGPYWLSYDRCVENPGHRECRMGGLEIQADRHSIWEKLSHLFTSQEDWIHQVDVYIQGPAPLDAGNEALDTAPIDKMGPASELHNQTLPLPVGRYRIYILQVAKNLVLYEQTTRIQSEWDTAGFDRKKKPTVLRVDHERFKYEPLQTQVARLIRKGSSGQGVAADKLFGVSRSVEPETKK